jgi:hypothetical protein
VPERELRRRLGAVCASFGLLHLLPCALVWLSSGGLRPIAWTLRTWSLLYYFHFLGLVFAGIGVQAHLAFRTRLFYGGPFIDFLLGVGGFMILETFAATLGGTGSASILQLVPGAALAAYGARLAGGRPLLGANPH